MMRCVKDSGDVPKVISRRNALKLAIVIAAFLASICAVRLVLQNKAAAGGSDLLNQDHPTDTVSVPILPGDIDIVKIPYSIFRKEKTSGIESAVERMKLPEFTVIPGLEKTFTNARAGRTRFDSWTRSHGDDFSSKFSELNQINKDNVRRLKPAWVYHSGEGRRVSNVEANPVFANGRIYVTSPAGFLLAIDAASGVEKWRTEINGVARRGLIWWPGNQETSARLFVPSLAGTYAIDPEDGSKIAAFGADGKVGSASLIAPVVDGDRLIVATLTPSVEAYDVETGKISWKRDLLKEENTVSRQTGAPVHRIGGGFPWAGMSLDKVRSKLYVSTGNPRPALYGATRLGNNELSSSVVCVDTRTGNIAWSFQEVAHDLWDFEVSSPPILTTIHRNGLPIDVVAAVTKIGNTLLLERDTGRPVFDYRLRRAPVSDVPGEETSPYQPALELPEPFMKQSFERSDITDLSAAQRTSVENKIIGAGFGFFPPPSANNKIVVFGLHGGAEWPGAAVNQNTGILYVPSNQFPWTLRLHHTDGQKAPAANIPYQQKCAGCHGQERGGFYETEFTGDKTLPSLVGISANRGRYELSQFRQDHPGTPMPEPVSADDLEQIDHYLHEADSVGDQRGSLNITGIWQLLLDRDRYPGSRPPWGMITAIDLNSGKRVWQVPFGEFEELTKRGIAPTGQPNFGGLFVTGAGLVFATGTIDRKIRALDADTGKQLWEYELPAAGSAPPSTYEIDGTQYLVVVATGGIFAGFKDRSDTIMAFKLDDH